MGALVSRGAKGISDMGAGGAGRAAAVQKAEQENKPTPPPPPIFYNPYQRKQKDADTYDSTLGESRFQGTAPRHF